MHCHNYVIFICGFLFTAGSTTANCLGVLVFSINAVSLHTIIMIVHSIKFDANVLDIKTSTCCFYHLHVNHMYAII